MKIRVYFGNRTLYLADRMDEELSRVIHHDDAVFMDELSAPGMNSMIHEMKKGTVHAGVFLHEDLEALKKAFWRKFMLVQAAGGLVFNEAGQVLLIFRRGRWDLPKGKLDPGESLDECAIREVREETGVSALVLQEFLGTTYHTYEESGHHILKESHWFSMTAQGEQTLTPQQTEDITEAVWAEKASLQKYTGKTYPSILEVWKKAGLI